MKQSKIPLWDLHCDTIFEVAAQHQPLFSNHLHIDLVRGARYTPWVQTFALWVADPQQGEDSFPTLVRLHQQFLKQLEQNRHQMQWVKYPHAGVFSSHLAQPCTALLSLENAAPLGEDLSRVGTIQQMGISMVTLVWNGRNAVGAGMHFPTQGLTPFGAQLVAALEEQEIVVDAAHLNEHGFFDLVRIAKKPFIVSHANVRAIAPHPRNLTDAQIACLFAQGGLLGLSFAPSFVTRAGKANYNFADVARQIEYVLSLDLRRGEQLLAIGSDFDGIPSPRYLHGIQALETLWEDMVRQFGKRLTQAIFFDNAARFYGRTDQIRRCDDAIL